MNKPLSDEISREKLCTAIITLQEKLDHYKYLASKTTRNTNKVWIQAVENAIDSLQTGIDLLCDIENIYRIEYCKCEKSKFHMMVEGNHVCTCGKIIKNKKQ